MGCPTDDLATVWPPSVEDNWQAGQSGDGMGGKRPAPPPIASSQLVDSLCGRQP